MTVEETKRQLLVLKGELIALSEPLHVAARALATDGMPVSLEIIERLRIVHDQYEALQNKIFKLFDDVPPHQPGIDSLISLADHLLREDETRRLAAVQKREIAIDTLKRIQLLEADATLPALDDCKLKAKQLAEEIERIQPPDLHPEVESFERGEHCFSHLLGLVQSQNLDSRSWYDLHVKVLVEFDQSLAIAASRGKLTFSPAEHNGAATSLEHEETFNDRDQVLPAVVPVAPAPAGDGQIETAPASPEDLLAEEVGISNEPKDASQAGTAIELVPHTGVTDPVEAPELAPETAPLPQLLEPISVSETKIDPEPVEVEISDAMVWQFLHEDRLQVAIIASKLRDGKTTRQLSNPPSWLIRSVLLARHVQSHVGELGPALQSDFAEINQLTAMLDASSEVQHAFGLLMIAASLRPALLLPNSGASTLLRTATISDQCPELMAFCRELAAIGDGVQVVDLHALRKQRTQEEWNKDLSKLQADLRAWSSDAHTLTASYAPATKVWQQWLRSGGLIFNLFQPVLKNDTSKLQFVESELRRLSKRNELQREVDQTDQQLNRHGQPIRYSAYEKLERNTEQALGYVRQWALLQHARPGKPMSYQQQQAQKAQGLVHSHVARVQSELAQILSDPSSYVQIAAKHCKRALFELSELVEPGYEQPDEPPLQTLLLEPLLKVKGVHVGTDWVLDESDPVGLTNAIAAASSASEMNWEMAYEESKRIRDHETTGIIVARLGQLGTHPELARKLVEDRERAIDECQRAQKNDLLETRRIVEEAVSYGLIGEQERIKLNSVIESIEIKVEPRYRFDVVRKSLNDVRASIEDKRRSKIEQIQSRLNGMSLPPADSIRLNNLLNRGDILTANEYVEMLLMGRSLPTDVDAGGFRKFFPAVYEQIEASLERGGSETRLLIGRMRERAKGGPQLVMLGPLEFGQGGGPYVKAAADMIEAWLTVMRSKNIEREQVEKILQGLGFSVIKATTRTDSRNQLDVEVEVVADRARCPIPDFGSRAEGHYRIHCMWDRPNAEDILAQVSATHSKPVIVMYFGRLNAQRRRELARLCHERKRTLIVLDTNLMMNVAAESKSRMHTFFETTLPFTFAEPYSTTAGYVPPEMFYGRAAERRQIVDPSGSCFIFGGRQLGKTALLRDIARTFNDREQGRIACWIDLKEQGIGNDRNIDDIWQLIARQLSEQGVDGLQAQMRPETMLTNITKWLDKDPGRRILVLLDEADRFLESDAISEYGRTTSLKGWMDRTQRRFKVVFAGLHNVQRATRQSNNPLAHFGDPICIGPLLSDEEWREAKELIERPFASLGFFFESPDLVTRILSQTNYYPSLIQLYCKHLLNHLDKKLTGFNSRSTPPYIITAQHIDDAYRSADLRKSIRDRFIWTLDLDKRYRVIAYTIAYLTLQSRDSLPVSFSVSTIRSAVTAWWPHGFQGASTESDIRVLLEEMVGLGILRISDSAGFALRNPNVILLLGTIEEIEGELLSSERLEPQQPYEADKFRAAYRGNHGESWRRNPLTAEQESHLQSWQNGVAIILGTPLAKMDELPAFLKTKDGMAFHHITQAISYRDLESELSSSSGRQAEGTTVYLVDANCPWSVGWVSAIAGKLAGMHSKKTFAKVVFVADPKMTWQLLAELPKLKANLQSFKSLTLAVMTLGSWHDVALRQWLQDCALADADINTKENRERIRESTGNWSSLLYAFYQRVRDNPGQWAVALESLQQEWLSKDAIAARLRGLGLDQQPHLSVLQAMAIYNEAISADELANVAGNFTSPDATSVIRWADMLGLVQIAGNDKWRLDPFLCHLLTAPQP